MLPRRGMYTDTVTAQYLIPFFGPPEREGDTHLAPYVSTVQGEGSNYQYKHSNKDNV